MRLARVVESFFPPLLAWGVGEGLGALVVGWEVYSSVKIEVGWVPCHCCQCVVSCHGRLGKRAGAAGSVL